MRGFGACGEPFSPAKNIHHQSNTISKNAKPGYVSIELDLPTTLAKEFEDEAKKAGLSLDDWFCGALSGEVKLSKHLHRSILKSLAE
jgi:hypothetical protein